MFPIGSFRLKSPRLRTWCFVGCLAFASTPAVAQDATLFSGTSTPARIGIEVVGGTAGAALGVVLGVLVAAPIVLATDSDSYLPLALGGVIGATLMAPLGTTLAGNMAGGDGGYGWSLLGTAVGMGVAIALVETGLYEAIDDGVAILIVGVLVVGSSVVFYEVF